jgi:hypothetical protein
MIAMFVCDKHAVESLGVFTNEREAARNLFGAQTGINKNARVAGNDQDDIAT